MPVGAVDEGSAARRWLPAFSVLALFLLVAALYATGEQAIYHRLLSLWGFIVTPKPFLDTDTILSAVRCQHRGIDVYVVNPCDDLRRVYDYSPLWLVLAAPANSLAWLVPVGVAVDALFLGALFLLPVGRSWRDTALITAGMLACPTAYALERGNNDLIIFALAVGAACLLVRSAAGRLVGYGMILCAGLLKYYPMAAMASAARESPRRFWLITAACILVAALFAAMTWHDLSRALALIPGGPFTEDMFGSITVGGEIAKKLHLAPVVATIIRLGMSLAALAIGTWLGLRADTRMAMATLDDRSRAFLLVGALLVLGCFFSAQNIGYRAVHLLLVLPALAVLRDHRSPARLRAACPVVLALLWSQSWRGAMAWAGGIAGGDRVAHAMVGITWALREALWWWLVTILFSLVFAELQRTAVVRSLLRLPPETASA